MSEHEPPVRFGQPQLVANDIAGTLFRGSIDDLNGYLRLRNLAILASIRPHAQTAFRQHLKIDKARRS